MKAKQCLLYLCGLWSCHSVIYILLVKYVSKNLLIKHQLLNYKLKKQTHPVTLMWTWQSWVNLDPDFCSCTRVNRQVTQIKKFSARLNKQPEFVLLIRSHCAVCKPASVSAHLTLSSAATTHSARGSKTASLALQTYKSMRLRTEYVLLSSKQHFVRTGCLCFSFLCGSTLHCPDKQNTDSMGTTCDLFYTPDKLL